MKKIVILILIGSLAIIGGFISILFALLPAIEVHNPLPFLLIGSFAIVSGIPVIVYARILYKRILATTLSSTLSPTAQEITQTENLLDKQTRLFKDWRKINETRDKLKMLKIAAAAKTAKYS